MATTTRTPVAASVPSDPGAPVKPYLLTRGSDSFREPGQRRVVVVRAMKDEKPIVYKTDEQFAATEARFPGRLVPVDPASVPAPTTKTASLKAKPKFVPPVVKPKSKVEKALDGLNVANTLAYIKRNSRNADVLAEVLEHERGLDIPRKSVLAALEELIEIEETPVVGAKDADDDGAGVDDDEDGDDDEDTEDEDEDEEDE